MTNYDYSQHEELLAQLLSLLRNTFTESEETEVKDFINVGEYGLALDTLVDIVNEENKQISKSALSLIYKLAILMELDKNSFESKLHNHVVDT
jgi:hypothetical protein